MNKRSMTVAAGAIWIVSLAAGAHLAAQGGGAHDHAAPERIAKLVTALGIRNGSVVADVGAGGGDYSVKLAREVGQEGRIYAVDVSASALTRLRSRVSSEKLENVQVVEGASDDPKLPAGAVDAVLIVNAYHEMTEYAAMLRRIREALKADGRLVILEPIGTPARERTREQQTRDHQIAPDIVLREVRAAGFEIIGLEDPFKSTHAHGDHEEWLLVAVPSSSANSKLQTRNSKNDETAARAPGVSRFEVWSSKSNSTPFSGERQGV